MPIKTKPKHRTKMPAKNKTPRKPASNANKKAAVRGGSFLKPKWRFNKQTALILMAVFAAIGGYMLYRSYAATIANPQTVWAACTNGGMYTPLSDSAAAALVTSQPEIREKNATPFTIGGVSYPAANNYTPTAAEITNYQNAINRYKQTNLISNPYSKFVTGNSTLTNPSTDDLIQWAAHKWGIPEDWLRSQYALESNWNHFGMGDLKDLSQELDYSSSSSGVSPSASTVSSWYSQEPSQAKFPSPAYANPPYPQVYESVGITQVKWRPNNDAASGTEPIRWKSTAFNIDHQASNVRFYYDDPQGVRTSWGDTSYVRCQQWNSIGGWFSPYPWGNSGQAGYISEVQNRLNSRVWTTSTFINQTFAYPSGITFNSATADNTPPTQPTNLTSPSQTSSSINLAWTASTDDIGVTGYDVYRNNAKVTTVATNSYSDSGLTASTTYSYYVIAKDAAGNPSQPSSTINVNTAATTTTSGTNLALGKLATSSSNESSSLAAPYAVDGSTTTRWGSAYSDPQWIKIDLGATYAINHVVLSWDPAYGKSYQIQVSNDATNWTSIYSTTTGDGGTDDLTGLSGSGRYIRMYGTVRGSSWGYSLWEFKVYNDGGSSTPPTADTTAPTVTIASPANGSTIRNSLTVNATATDNVKVTKLEVWFDGALKCSSAASPISCGITTRKSPSGAHTITAKAYDAAGNAGQTSITVYK